MVKIVLRLCIAVAMSGIYADTASAELFPRLRQAMRARLRPAPQARPQARRPQPQAQARQQQQRVQPRQQQPANNGNVARANPGLNTPFNQIQAPNGGVTPFNFNQFDPEVPQAIGPFQPSGAQPMFGGGAQQFGQVAFGPAGGVGGGFNHGMGAMQPPAMPIQNPGAFGQVQRGARPPAQQPFATGNGLIPAGTNGNPAWSFAVTGGRNAQGRMFSENCQASLISASPGMCVAATAAHCLMAGARRNGGQNNPQIGALVANNVPITTPDFGNIRATVYVNTNLAEDVAAFAWQCDGARNVPVVQTVAGPLQDGQAVYYGKVMGGKAGLYIGRVQRPDPRIRAIMGRAPGDSQERVVQNLEVAIQQGDSGGPLLVRQQNGAFVLAGILSSYSGNRTQSNYMTNRSMGFIQRINAGLGGGTPGLGGAANLAGNLPGQGADIAAGLVTYDDASFL